MIGRLTGTISQSHRNPVVMDVGGVGYLVHVPEKLANSVETGTHTLYIHTHVREESLDLYGFSDENELALFQLLLTVSGIGPKTALLVVDRGVMATQKAVRAGDVDFFTTIPRLGRKNAQKIIIDLKNKLGSSHELNLNSASETKQIIEALVSMGYHRKNIIDALTKIQDNDKTIEQRIKHVIKLL